jgi:hypothetical protein
MQSVETTTSSPNSTNAVLAAVKYGQSSTYPFELDKERLEWLSDKVNRSKGQTQFLFQMVGGDFEKLKALEVQIKNCFVRYCPAYFEEVEKVMALVPKSNWFTLSG